MVSFKCGINKKSTKEQTEQTKNRLIEKKTREMIARGDWDGGMCENMKGNIVYNIVISLQGER